MTDEEGQEEEDPWAVQAVRAEALWAELSHAAAAAFAFHPAPAPAPLLALLSSLCRLALHPVADVTAQVRALLPSLLSSFPSALPLLSDLALPALSSPERCEAAAEALALPAMLFPLRDAAQRPAQSQLVLALLQASDARRSNSAQVRPFPAADV
jgi:hypothetical protein